MSQSEVRKTRGVVYRSVRGLMNLVEYERDAFGYILARSNELLNYRKVLGFAILPYNTSKTVFVNT